MENIFQNAHLTDDALNLYLDRFLDPEEISVVEQHLSTCTECSKQLSALQTVFTALNMLPDMDMERDISTSVISAITPPLQLPNQLKWGVFAQAAIALTVIIITAPIYLNFQSARLLQTWLRNFNEFVPQNWLELTISWAHNIFSWQIDYTAWLPALPKLPSIDFAHIPLWPLFLVAVVLFVFGNGLLLRRLSIHSSLNNHKTQLKPGG
ncbi:MAG: zf-HC2 domain-containing protein [Anaerolineaceae bacterium]|nr:zf-HC2 domain-containing protein [Anaerolineaceae bacterium]